MKTIALRFSDNFAPDDGTIVEHQAVINDFGYCYYGKLGTKVSKAVANNIINVECPKILLIHSGKTDRYWAYIESISNETPELDKIPEYYRNNHEKFNTWFKVVKFEKAPNNVMSKCRVSSSGTPLNMASKASMSPYFIIDYNEEN